MATIAERVAAGMALLDQIKPGWDDDIDLGRLNLESCTSCVLGQVFGEYSKAVEMIYATGQLDGYPEELGFNHSVRAPSYENLTRAWVQAITDRRAAPEPRP